MNEELAIAEIQQTFLSLIRTLVDDTQAVELRPVTDGTMTTFSVRVAKTDIGKLIGKQGRNARSLRVLLSAAGRKYDYRFALDIEGA